MPKHYGKASQSVTTDDAEEAIISGQDPEPYVDMIEEFANAGFERIYLHHVGQDQTAFIEFMDREILPEF